MIRLSAAVLIAAALFAAPAAAQQAVLLRYAPPAGQVSHYRTASQTWMQIPGMPSDSTRPTMTRTLYQTRTVTAVEAGTRTVTTTVDSSVQDLGPMTGMMPGGDIFRGITITQRLDSLGDVSSADVTTPPDANPMIAQAMRSQASQRQFLLPARRVSPGDTWTSSDTMPLGEAQGGGHAIIELTYTLVKVDRSGGSPLATISMTGAMSSDNPGAQGAPQGQMTGTMVFDLDAGRLAHSTTTMTAQVQSPDGGQMPVRTVSTTDLLP